MWFSAYMITMCYCALPSEVASYSHVIVRSKLRYHVLPSNI